MDTPARHAAPNLDAPAAPDTWLNAIRGLRNNPLAQYLPLMQRRLEARTIRRTLLLRIALTIAALTVIGIIMHHALRSSGIGATERSVILGLVLAVPAFAVLYFRGLLTAFTVCLSALNRRPGIQKLSIVEDLACNSHMTEREIICGLGRFILPVLLRRVIAGAIMLQLGLVLITGMESGAFQMHPVYTTSMASAELAQYRADKFSIWRGILGEVGAAAPAALIGMAAVGTLACLICMLWLIGMGRRTVSQASITAEAGVLAMLQMMGSLYAFVNLAVYYFQGLDPAREFMAFNHFFAGYLTAAALIGAFAGISFAAQRGKWLRLVMPVFLPVCFAGLAVTLMNQNSIILEGLDGWHVYAGAALHWLSALCLVSPLAIPAYSRSAVDSLSVAGMDAGIMWTAWPLALIGFQLALLPLAAHFAEVSTRRFTRGE